MNLILNSKNKYTLAIKLRKLLYEIKTVAPTEFKVYKNTTQLSNEQIVNRLSLILYNFTQQIQQIQVTNKKVIILQNSSILLPTVFYLNSEPADLKVEFKLEEGTSEIKSRFNVIVKYKITDSTNNDLKIEYVDYSKSNELQNIKYCLDSLKNSLFSLKAEIAKWSNA